MHRTLLIVCICAVLLLAFVGVNVDIAFHRIYDQGYTDGHEAGYRQGRIDGKRGTLAYLKDWIVQSGCQQTVSGYVRFKMWIDTNGEYQYTCLVSAY